MTCPHLNATIHYAEGYDCNDCGKSWRVPAQFKAIFARWDKLETEAEEAWAKKKARRTVKDVAVGEESGVAITPAVAALFTDEKPELGRVWKCEKCHRAPRRHPDFANNWKWKTERGFLKHKCLGGER